MGTEQILLGLIGESTGIAAKVLKSMGVNLKVRLPRPASPAADSVKNAFIISKCCFLRIANEVHCLEPDVLLFRTFIDTCLTCLSFLWRSKVITAWTACLLAVPH